MAPRAEALDRADPGHHASCDRLDENIGATDVDLTVEDLREIDAAASRITVHGARYPEHLEALTGL